MKNKLSISIILPFYNASSTLRKCVDSILNNQCLSNGEIICVDDGSTDNSVSILMEIKKEHPELCIIKHTSNRGLFQARLTGLQHANGKYIAFIDSDDYVSDGFYDAMLLMAEKQKTDVTICNIINCSADGVSYIQSDCMKKVQESIDAHSYYEDYWKQQGMCYHYHVIWNKLYRKKIWKNSLKYLKKINTHLIMMEDFVFNSIVLNEQRTYIFQPDASYYYVENANSAISIKSDFDDFKKKIQDVIFSFQYVEHFLCSKKMNQYYGDFYYWKERYGRIWNRNIEETFLSESEKDELYLLLHDGLNLPEKDDDRYYKKAIFLNANISNN